MTFKTVVRRNVPRPINEIAEEIADNYESIAPAAAEALDSLRLIETVHDTVYDQTGREVIREFLENATGWGQHNGGCDTDPAARRLRDELERALRAA